jgi:hypothetical protein
MTYKTPKLIAMSAPTFSFLLMATFQTIFHGKRDRTMSRAPEYTVVVSAALFGGVGHGGYLPHANVI